MTDKKKTPTAAEQLKAILAASPKLGLDDLFASPHMLQRELAGVPFSVIGAKAVPGLDGEYVEFTVEPTDGELKGTAVITDGQLTTNNLKIVAYFSQNPKGKVTGATFGKQGREFYVTKYKEPEKATS
ncbi:MAG TPA: hypothetical protein VGO47_14705 [Chlamydiales bacterium]|jgi:hypothetical protein|nr:hypothetical protein [Chlamydiales bacterium]